MKPTALLACLLSACLFATHPAARTWEPAEGTTPQTILREAAMDVSENRLAQADEKYAWLYDHALATLPGDPGVTPGSLLPPWARLARHYPPALARVVAARDRLLPQLAEGGRKSIYAMSALTQTNRQLGDHTSTRDAFVQFAARDPVMAETSGLLEALPAFIALQDFDQAGRYLNLPVIRAHFERLHGSSRTRAPEAGNAADMQRSFQRFADLRLARVTLVLVKTGRQTEAEALVQHFRTLLGPQVSLHHMSAALNGVAPPGDD